MKNEYKIITFAAAILICLIVIYLNLSSHDKTQEIYLEQTEETIIYLKKDFLKDTVDNIILELDRLRETKNKSYEKNTTVRFEAFQEELKLSDKEFEQFYADKFEKDLDSQIYTSFLWDVETGEILYNSSEPNLENTEEYLKELKSSLSTFKEIKKDSIEGIFGVSKNYIDETVKEEIAEIIRNRKYSNESYIWVNEVLNYEGGENYDIRRVHPNLRNTEGTYLSTDMEDIKGNLPYLEELEGVKKDGEIFFTYYFKKLNIRKNNLCKTL